MNEQWEAKIIYRPERLGWAVYLARKDSNGHIRYMTKGGFEQVVVDGSAKATDDPIYLMVEDEAMLRALALEIAKTGYKAPDQHLIEGKLEATEKHLNDMRKITFKKLGVNDD